MGLRIYKKKRVLLIGGSGQLGKNIVQSKLFKNLDFPKKNKLNLLNIKQIDNYVLKKYEIIINCSGYARVRDCEKNPLKAIDVNINGILNLIKSLKKNKINSRIIHISSDAVYNPIKKNHSEKSVLKPYNFYGFTKYYGESLIKNIKNSVIIRTRFFDKNKIKYPDAAVDVFSSMIEIRKLSKIIFKIANSKFIGIINVGDKNESDFKKISKFNKRIKKTYWSSIQKKSNVIISKDSTMNLTKMKKILNLK